MLPFSSILGYSLSYIFKFRYDHLMINHSICDVISSCIKPTFTNFWQIQKQWGMLFQSNTKQSEICFWFFVFCLFCFFPLKLKQNKNISKKDRDERGYWSYTGDQVPAQSWIRDLILDGEATSKITRLQHKLLSKSQQTRASAEWAS